MDKQTHDFILKTARGAFWDGITEWLWLLSYILFAAGAALLIAYVILPASRLDPDTEPSEVLKQGKLKRLLTGLGCYRIKFGQIGALLLLFICAISQQLGIDARRGFIADQDKHYEMAIKKMMALKDKQAVLRAQYLYMPEGNSLAYLSLGNTSIAADYIWLTSTQYVSSSFRRGNKFDLLYRFYSTMLDLDPHWIEAEVNAGKILSALEQDRYKVEDYYKKTIVQNPDNWRLPFEAAHLFVVPPLDATQRKKYSNIAVQWFNEALKKLNRLPKTSEHDLIKRDLGHEIALLSMETGDLGYYRAADELLLSQMRDADYPEALRSAASIAWLSAHSMVIVSELNELVQKYKRVHGTFPSSLGIIMTSLKDGGKHYEADAFGFPIEYDAATGEVSSRGANARRAVQAAYVMDSLIQYFRDDHDGRVPFDTTELQAYVRKLYAPPTTPPFAMADALGAELDTIQSPLGSSWDYDPILGRVRLPSYCETGTLFRNGFRMMDEIKKRH